MKTDRWIVIPNWDEFQHYKDRDPRWIKNYTRLLADRNYLGLTSRLRGILHGIWLLYAASGRDLGANPAQLGLMLGDTSVRKRDIESLSRAGFLTVCASRPLATRYQVASPEEETETEEETEQELNQNQDQGPFIARPPARADTNSKALDEMSISEQIKTSLRQAQEAALQ